jgi:hypothetical protein
VRADSSSSKIGTGNLLKALLNTNEAPSEEKSNASSFFARNDVTVMFVSAVHGVVVPLTRAWAAGPAPKM